MLHAQYQVIRTREQTWTLLKHDFFAYLSATVAIMSSALSNFFFWQEAQLKEGLIFRLQPVSAFSERFYSSVKLASILTKMHVTQVLSHPCS